MCGMDPCGAAAETVDSSLGFGVSLKKWHPTTTTPSSQHNV